MKKITLMIAVIIFSYSYAQEKPQMDNKMKLYSEKIDNILAFEKSQMNLELDKIDKNFQNNKITLEQKQKQKSEIALKYEKIINVRVDNQKSELENVTKELVQNAVFGKPDTIRKGKNLLQLGVNGLKMKLNQNNKKTPKDYLHNWSFSYNFSMGNLTSKDKPFGLSSKNSDTEIVYNSIFALKYENQVGGFESPIFYNIGLGIRTDRYQTKDNNVFVQKNNVLKLQNFSNGNLKDAFMRNTYVFVPVDFRFVLNPKYKEYNGVKYLDNTKSQLSLIAGIYGGANIGSKIITKYSNENSKSIVDKERVMHGVNDFIVGGKLGVGYKGFNLYIQKDFNPLFNKDAKLMNKNGFQIGIEVASLGF